MASEFEITEGTLPDGLPFFRLGSGPRLIVLRGFTTTHDNPKGMQRTFEVKMLAPLARRFDIYAVNRAPGLAPSATMAEIAAQHAEALRAGFGEPVDVLGISCPDRYARGRIGPGDRHRTPSRRHPALRHRSDRPIELVPRRASVRRRRIHRLHPDRVGRLPGRLHR